MAATPVISREYVENIMTKHLVDDEQWLSIIEKTGDSDKQALVAEIRALRTERDELLRVLADIPPSPDYRSTMSCCRDARIHSLHEQMTLHDETTAELAAERARHEATRAAVEALCNIECFADVDAFDFKGQPCVSTDRIRAALAAASPVAGQEAGTWQ
jgi:hypothetical protein